MITKLMKFVVVVIAITSLFSCSSAFGGSDGSGRSTGVAGVSARIAGGSAVALGSSRQNSPELLGSSVAVSNIVNDSIFTVFEDGSMIPALDFDGGYQPEISFTAVAPNGYLYVQLEHSYNHEHFGLFAINTKTDEVYVAGTGGVEGAIKTWYWDHSAVRTRPIIFNEEGRAFFVVNTWHPQWSERIASWMPGEPEVRFETIAIDGVSIDRFQVDNIGRKYVSGHISSHGFGGNYLQVFDPRASRGRYVFLSDEGDGWVRGYIAVGDRVILNGWNILGGYNGIVSLKSSIVDGEIEFSQQLIFDNDTETWFDPGYYSRYDDWSGTTVHRGLFESKSGSYGWADHWKTDGQLDQERILEYLSRFYVEDIYIDFSHHTATTTYPKIREDNDNWYWLKENVKRATDHNKPAVTFYEWRKVVDIPWLSFSDISDMSILPDGSLWGIYRSWDAGQPTVWLQLMDSDGNRDLNAVLTKTASGANTAASLIQFADDQMFYRYRGERIGTHRIAAVSRTGDFTDITRFVDDIEFMTIYDYSVGGGFLYFSGYDGIEIVTGRIDLSTGAYDRIETDRTITSIDVLY